MISLTTPLSSISGVGPKFVSKLKKLKIETVKDLIFYFPTRYEDFSHFYRIADLVPNQEATICGTIKKISGRRAWHKHLYIVEAIIEDNSSSIKAIWFNQPYIKNILRLGCLANFSGKVVMANNKPYLSNPIYELINDKNRETKHTARIIPIYPETKGLTSKGLRYLIKPLLEKMPKIFEILPEEILKKNHLPEINKALKDIHFPQKITDALLAKKRFAFEDLFLLELHHLQERLSLSQEKAPAIEIDISRLKKLIQGLPFELTSSQKKSLWEILQDLKKSQPMNRLLQGDVGSGKTIVAALAALETAYNGYQIAFMAPTEILARQHYQTLIKFFPNFDKGLALLTSSEAKIYYDKGLETKIKKAALQKEIEAQKVSIIIGTHALIQKNIHFPKLALVIIDEQHRFGVSQRASLLRQSTPTNTQINADTSRRSAPTQIDTDKTQIDADKTPKTPINADKTQINADAQDNEFLYKDLTYKIRGAIFNIYNELGPGHKEAIYHKALIIEFKKRKINFDTEKSLTIKYDNKKLGIYKPDFIIEDKVILEIKALPFIGKIEEKQIWHYLKGSDYKLALLVNFGSKQLTIKRVVYDQARLSLLKSASDLRESASNLRESASALRESASNLRESASKSKLPHFLSMSATPIPRTLNLVLFGDLDLSLISEMPKNRRPIITKIVSSENRDKAYQFIKDQIKMGRQAFVICPRINPAEEANLSEMNKRKKLWLEVKNVIKEYERLSQKIFPDLKVAMLHGKMKSQEKIETMKKFQEGKIDILVSTSVVEVGTDIGNVTIMMIEGAERFGLAQLYQFRGRVGRSEHQSYCLLFTDSDSLTIKKRLHFLLEAKNGFELAEKDLKMRGPGEFFGEAQTGLPDLAMKAIQNPDLFKAAREAAKQILFTEKNLEKYPLLAEKLSQFQKQIHWE